METNRRDFLKKSLKLTAATTAVVGATTLLAKGEATDSSGVSRGKSKKKEVLYKKSEAWEKYYKTVY
ncbi:MAG: twin-arginine translocation signal domain-containing protein [Campylobacter sp.]|nr:twin-arginine translocation signal domain-containing protein [Campylobacter sp.]